MTKDEYIALIEKRLKKWLIVNPTIRTDIIAEDLAAHIWSPMEVARAVQELAVNSNLSFHEAMRVMDDFVKVDAGLDSIPFEFKPEEVVAPILKQAAVMQPGDKLVIRVPTSTSRDIHARMTEKIRKDLPGVDVVILGAEDLAIYRRQSAKMDLRSPERWLETDFKGYQILDPDGWRGPNYLDWRTPLTREEFRSRMLKSTIQAPIEEQRKESDSHGEEAAGA